MNEADQKHIRMSFHVARQAREHGNHPFGAVLVNDQGMVLMDAENTVVTERDCTGHAETNLMRKACRQYDPDFLSRCTLYTSTEPCPMCAAAIFWGNVRRVVYGLNEAELYAIVGDEEDEVLHLPCREVFARGRKQIEVIGPVLEAEARKVHEGFWDAK